MTDVLIVVGLLLAFWVAATVTWNLHRRHRPTPGRHRPTTVPTTGVTGRDAITATRLAGDAAQARMTAAIRRETGQ